MSTKKSRAVKAGLEHAAAICASNGTALTALRQSVLQLVLQAEGPLTAYQLLDRLKALRASAVPATIYRALEFLTENGLVHKVERLNAFVPCTDHDHGHRAVQFLICRRCGTVAELEDDAIAKALAKAAADKGFVPQRALVELDGTCAACRK
jgi:Fur family zinc uptake transcriptional regulator